jgi:alginate O-acetyltransferase complex protein AlgI
MSFASPAFLWYFLPAVLAMYLILPKTWRNGLLSAASLLFYVWGAGEFVFLLLACMVVNFTAGILIDSVWAKKRSDKRRAVLITARFLSIQTHNLAQSLGLGDTTIIALALPIGISFYTFHHMSYVIDVYRGSRSAQKSPIQFITYIAMFPQLIAGPIVRYNEISEQPSDTNRDRWADISRGLP